MKKELKELKEVKKNIDKIYTYLMFDGLYYKIGKSKNPEKRLKQIQTSNPLSLLLEYSDKVDEKNLHKLYSNYRIKNEWFNLNDKQVEEIKYFFKKGYKETIVDTSKVESIDFGNFKLKTTLKGTYKLSTYDRQRIIEGQQKNIKKNIEYVINFGKYKGTKITDMVSEEQIKYMEWYINNVGKKGKNDRRFKAINYQYRKITKNN